MAKLTADSFLNVLQQSDLIEQDRIKSLIGQMQSDGIDVQDSTSIGSWMVKNEHLTSWQVGKLQRGKHKGFRLGKYRLRELLGKGGMSSVYLAEHTLMRRRCAIKVLPIKKVNDSSYLARFFREAQAVASLDHPNIVRAYDIDKEVEKTQEIHFLVMEYVKGRSLHEIVKEDGPLSFEDSAEFGRQAALGLDHAHQSGLVHRDVKPGNLLQDLSGTVKVLDLGLARFSEVTGNDDEAPLTVAHDEKVLGTADYLSPEQALDSHLVDNRADIYSLGCSLYFALSGQPPFNEGTIAQRLMWHQMKEPKPLTELRKDLPESLAAIVSRMMAKKPEDRFQTMGDVASALLTWLAKNASPDWKRDHGDVFAGADAPTAMPVAPVAAPVQSATPAQNAPAPPQAVSPPAPVASPVGTSDSSAGSTAFESPPAAAQQSGGSDVAFPGLPAGFDESAAPGSAPEPKSGIVQEPAAGLSGAGATARNKAPADTSLDLPGGTAVPASGTHVAGDDSGFPGLPGGAVPDGSTLDTSASASIEPVPQAPAEPAPVINVDGAPPAPTAAPIPPAPADAAFPDFSAPAPEAVPLEAAPVSNAGGPAEAQFAPPGDPPVFDPGVPTAGADPNSGFPPAANSPSRFGTRPAKKSAPPAGLILGAIALVAVIGAGIYLSGGGDDSVDSGDSTQAGSETQTGTRKGGGTGSGGPAKFLGYELTVGSDGNFKTLAAMLKYLRDSRSSYGRSLKSRVVVKVAPGRYPESLIATNGDGETYPTGIHIVCEGASPAVLAPSGSEPVVKLTNMEFFGLEGFQVDASNREVGIELNGDLDRSTLKNITITGYSQSGIHSKGASGSARGELVIENVRFRPSGSNSVGIKFAENDASRTRIYGCRFIGPQKSAVVFDEGASEVTIKESILAHAESGITFSKADPTIRRVAIFNNTFYDCSKAGIHMASAPSSSLSFEFSVHRNLFSRLGGAEVVVATGYDLKGFQSFVSTGEGGARFNWSDRQEVANKTTEWEVILREEQRVSEIAFVSTDSSSPDFLKPATPFNGFRPGAGSKRYPGAVDPG